MEAGDVDEVVALVASHREEMVEHARNYFRRQYRSGMAPRDGARHFVMELDHAICGVSGYESRDLDADDVFWISWVFVDPYCQGQGLGSRLLRQVEDDIATHGGRKIYVEVPALEDEEGEENQAIPFLEANGYRREAKLAGYGPGGGDLHVFGKNLA